MPAITNKAEIMTFIDNYHKYDKPISYQETDIESFFDIDDDFMMSNADILHDQTTDERIQYNEIDSMIDQVTNDKEYFIFRLRALGKSYQEIGKFLNMSHEGVRKIYIKIFDRLL
ncbi:hypothetical protein [Mammaliicoccus sciuri]|uniref:RNA polymerase sigma-70 region 4 domain-containing protein n=1 Tax=Mammaliicoccus sciuri TaxID=1296 RepID=A0AAI8DK85_MAMSC|nr:hypothetical protein [Mammaliicoccus sciuri]ASE35347.1 hypothetical protein CEP64_12355 [Mammaliicoccus sciuri]